MGYQGSRKARLEYLMQDADGTLAQVTDLSVLAELLAIGGDVSDFSSTTDSLEALSNAIAAISCDSPFLASVGGALDAAVASGAVTDTDTAMAYIKQLVTAIQLIPTTAMRGTDNAALASVLGALNDAAASGAVTDADTGIAYLKQLVTSNVSDGGCVSQATMGPAISGRAVTATLYVSPDGDDSNGLSWTTAYQTIQGALDAASTDADDLTLILISPHATQYDIDTTGDPTWAANVILQGGYRNWSKVVNTHASATSILKLTGKSAVVDLNFNLGSGSGDGLILTHGGCRVNRCQFVGEDLTGAATALWLDHATVGKHAKVIDVDFLGNQTYMTALLIDGFERSRFRDLRIHNCLAGIQIVGSDSDSNDLCCLGIGGCTIGIDIDAGNEQHFHDILFHDCTTRVDDEVGDHVWNDIRGEFEITSYPVSLAAGVVVTTGAANAYGNDTELRPAAEATKPFRIVGFSGQTSTNEWYRSRFSADSGSTFFTTIQIDANKSAGDNASPGTEFIFNKGTRISVSAKDVSGGDTVTLWIHVQEI